MRIAQVISFERVEEDGAHVADVKVEPDADPITVRHSADPGDDSQPLAGDTVVLDEDRDNIVGYEDTKNAGVSGPGEKRIYARKSDGSLAFEIWMKADETLVIGNANGKIEMAANGDVTINGVVIKADGNVTAPKDIKATGEVTAKDGPTKVSLATHTHPHPFGPTGAPTPNS